MWYVLRNNVVVRYIIAAIVAGAVAYFLVATLAISHFFPQYHLIKNYSKVTVCTNLAPGTPSKFFLPISCTQLNTAHAVGCIYNDKTTNYSAPARPSSAEKTLCPLFVRDNDATGVKNSALPVLPITENAVRNIIATSTFAIFVVIFIVIKMLTRKNRRSTYR
jgi:hypothetical protein